MIPLIGLTTDATAAATDDHPAQRCAAVPEPCLEAVERAGGRPLLLPPSPRPADDLLDRIDALVVIGGGRRRSGHVRAGDLGLDTGASIPARCAAPPSAAGWRTHAAGPRCRRVA